MYFVYIIQSKTALEHYYVGTTDNVFERLKEHNDGQSTHSNKFKPWKLVTYVAFESSLKAKAFEEYLKSGSGRAFCKKHF